MEDVVPDHADPCVAAQNGAQATCQSGGGNLGSFSCNPQTGEYSFTCNLLRAILGHCLE